MLDGRLATSPQEAQAAAAALLAQGAPLVVVKAQVKTGGRGKAGGVRLARTAAGARRACTGGPHGWWEDGRAAGPVERVRDATVDKEFPWVR